MSLNAVELRTEKAALVHEKYLNSKVNQESIQSNVSFSSAKLSNDKLVLRMFSSPNGPAIMALWGGDTSAYDNDDSRADFALCSYLAYWTNGDFELIDTLFRLSGLYREKWERENYRVRTINKAINGQSKPKNLKVFASENGISFISPISSPEVMKRYTLDDMGTARLFADTFRDKVLYFPNYSKYWVYMNGVWKMDLEDMKTRQYAKEMSDYLMDIIPPSDPDDKNDLYATHRKHYSKYRYLKYRKTLIQDAQDEMEGNSAQFDSLPFLFNMKNGTFNLETFQLQPHNSAQMLTKMANVIYDPDARYEPFEQFLFEINEGNIERQNMLIKALGYCLKGEANEECYFTAIGNKTRNGKGTLFDTVLNIFGDYGAEMDFNTIARSGNKDGSRVTPDLARLKSVRYVLANEPEKGVCLNEALLKQITGGDDITARPLYGNVIQFKPVFKLFVTTNSKPAVSDDSLFASGRVKILLFNRHFTESERDTGLKMTFRSEAAKSGIFNLLLDGYKKYLNEGLKDTAEMKEMTEEYRLDNDYITQYFDARFDFDVDISTQLMKIRADYALWCEQVGTKPLGLKMFKEELEKRGIKIRTIHNHVLGLSGKLRDCYN